ncbi:MAG: coenzyme F420-0:L-glutamate ligase [Rhodospirillales bacterium]
MTPVPSDAIEHQPQSLSLIALHGLPAVSAGDDLAALVLEAAGRQGLAFKPCDVLCLTEKLFAKAEGRLVPLTGIEPGDRALRFAREAKKDPRLVQLILDESLDVLRIRPGLMITEHRLGTVMADGGVDTGYPDGFAAEDRSTESALLLPLDPDASARNLRQALETASGVKPLGVVLTDSIGRPWREGTVGFALGSSGPSAIRQRRGRTVAGWVDLIASAAELLMGEGDRGCPAIILSGLNWSPSDDGAARLNVDRERDLYR